jgi:transcriptional regulator with XRE-family HTH domain
MGGKKMVNRRELSQSELEDTTRLRQIWDEKKDSLSLSQQDVADAFGIANQTAISQYLNGKIPLNLEAAIKFAKILEVNIKQISPRHALWVYSASDKVLGDALHKVFQATTKPFCFEVTDAVVQPEVMVGDIACFDTASRIDGDGIYLFDLGKGSSMRHAKISSDEEHVTLSGNGVSDTTIPLSNTAMLSITGRLMCVLRKFPH